MNKLPPTFEKIVEELRKGETSEQIIERVDTEVREFHPFAKAYWEAAKTRLLHNRNDDKA